MLHITYAKENSKDICIKIEISNRYHEAADITVLLMLWFYNRWQSDASEKNLS